MKNDFNKPKILYVNFSPPGDYDAGIQRMNDLIKSFSVPVKKYNVPLNFSLKNKLVQFFITKLLEIPASIILFYDIIFSKQYRSYNYIILWPLTISFIWIIPVLKLFGKIVIYDYNDDFHKLSNQNFPYNIISYVFVYIPQFLSQYLSTKNLVTIGIFENMPARLRKKSLAITTGFNEALFFRMNNFPSNNSDKKLKIGYFGGIRKEFDLDFALRTINKTNLDIEVHLYGKNYGIEIPEDKRFIYKGSIPINEVPMEMNKMDILLNSFKYNDLANSASPVKVFEYMACGKPILSARVESIKKVLKNEHNSLIYEASDEADFIRQLVRLVNNNNLREKLGNRAEIDAKSYTWKKICNDITEFIIN